MVATVLGAAATMYGLASAIAPLLQLRTVLRTRSSADLSLASLGITVGGSMLWLMYGIAISSVALIVVDIGTLSTGLVTLVVASRMRGSRSERALVERAPRRHIAGANAPTGARIRLDVGQGNRAVLAQRRTKVSPQLLRRSSTPG